MGINIAAVCRYRTSQASPESHPPVLLVGDDLWVISPNIYPPRLFASLRETAPSSSATPATNPAGLTQLYCCSFAALKAVGSLSHLETDDLLSLRIAIVVSRDLCTIVWVAGKRYFKRSFAWNRSSSTGGRKLQQGYIVVSFGLAR